MGMKIVTRIVREETYTFTPNDGTEPIHIRSGLLREWLLEHAMDKVIRLTFPSGQTEQELIEQHGLEADRMASMTEEEAKEPVIVGLWPGGTHILIDGGHRRWFWAMRGQNDLQGWAVPVEVWSQFTFDLDQMVGIHHRDGSLLPQRSKK